MRTGTHYRVLFCTVLLASCRSLEHGLSAGYYTIKTTSSAPKKVYAAVNDSTIAIYPLLDGENKEVDTSKASVISRVQAVPGGVSLPITLVKKNVDVDLTSVLFKYRFSNSSLPNQLNSNLNAAVYTGYRIDFFRLYDTATPLKRKERRMRHFEVDGGLFAGIGSASINASVTNNHLDVEYDGLVFQKGAAIFVGAGNLTLGIGLGADSLLDKNKSLWIYHQKLWLGLMVGINISG
ncbi:MAG TPA: hypothetical protein PK228_03620 [Saprospiraceae bacterium]|nr:hypothetical protein [Saprospiraceae bacterium]